MNAMKINYGKFPNYLIVASLALGACGARAGWIIQSPGPIFVTPGEHGSSAYIFTPDVTGTITGQSAAVYLSGMNQGAPGASQPITAYAASALPVAFTAPIPFEVTVNWTISQQVYNDEEFTHDFSLTPNPEGGEAATEFFIDPPIAAVPEPLQTIAGGLIVGCGGVIFAGRRLLKSQAPG
jgi:hypothetical protein